MSIECRLGFIVIPKEELFSRLKDFGSDLGEYFKEKYVVVTEQHDYEEYFEGWNKSIVQNFKVFFVRDTIYSLDYCKDELVSIFGNFSDELELFDKWWTYQNVECSEMPTNWKNT